MKNISNLEIKELIKQCGILAQNLQDDVNLSDQGVDSLDKASLFLNIEETYNIKISADEFMELNTIDKIVKHINEKL
ncbi:acyl carrier protein [Candidatus Campylobacter infans]|uniref:Acyl carrier protein n=1 Tax=Candidatus Campylobacter infans TaxID=2561898 RepID=A0A7H9CIR7_9BACT|nr:acyl carrier protein [Candidatus Campylobacter infans]KAF0591115.1 MAG: acyl carrier protein [Candidatus Campylobacter infans]QLI04689.1 acyl carrier protein [Candidatus Campylobacter infans]